MSSVYRIDINVNGGGSGGTGGTGGGFASGAATSGLRSIQGAAALGSLGTQALRDFLGGVPKELDPYKWNTEGWTEYGPVDQWRVRYGNELISRNFFTSKYTLTEEQQSRTRGARYSEGKQLKTFQPWITSDWERIDTLGEKTVVNWRNVAFTGATAVRMANTSLNNTFKWKAATATSLSELQGLDVYNNVREITGTALNIAGSAWAGFKIGGGVGAAIGAAGAVATEAINDITNYRIAHYKQAVNETSSMYQQMMLGDASYGRSRQTL